MRSIVTGGAGFIGSHLVDALLKRGDEVVVLDDLSSGSRQNLKDASDKGLLLLEVDVSDARAVSDAVEKHRPHCMFHLAAQIDVRRSVADPLFDLRVNVAGTLNLLEAARARAVSVGKGPRLVFASTGGAIYGEGEGRGLPLDEGAARLPDAPYGQSKYAAEGYLSVYARLYGLTTISLRLGNVYGPRQDPHGEAGVVAIFCGALLDGARPRVFGDGRQTRDYIYVADVVSAFLAAAASGTSDAYNVGTGLETSVLELGKRIAAICERPFEPEMAPPRQGEVQRIAIDSARAQRELGWRPQASLEDGLRSTVASFSD